MGKLTVWYGSIEIDTDVVTAEGEGNITFSPSPSPSPIIQLHQRILMILSTKLKQPEENKLHFKYTWDAEVSMPTCLECRNEQKWLCRVQKLLRERERETERDREREMMMMMMIEGSQ